MSEDEVTSHFSSFPERQNITMNENIIRMMKKKEEIENQKFCKIKIQSLHLQHTKCNIIVIVSTYFNFFVRQ